MIQAGLGQNAARQAELKAGIPDSVPAITVNRVCVSSASALAMAAAAIKAGDGEIYLVGGTENMTRAPWVLQNGRSGYRMGMPTDKMYDTMVLGRPLGRHRRLPHGRDRREPQRAVRHQQGAAERGRLQEPAQRDRGDQGRQVQGRDRPGRRSRSARATPRSSTPTSARARRTPEILAGLKPVFKKDGVVTAGNASAHRRRRQRRRRHVAQEGRRARPQADRPARELRDGRRRARDHGPTARPWPPRWRSRRPA